MIFGERAGWCVTLGIVLAQPRSCPQTSALAGFCPRCHNSGNRAWCTGLAATQVRVSLGKTGVVHTPGHALLLRLCIYRKHKKKTGDKSSAPAPAGSGGPQSPAKGRGMTQTPPARGICSGFPQGARNGLPTWRCSRRPGAFEPAVRPALSTEPGVLGPSQVTPKAKNGKKPEKPAQ